MNAGFALIWTACLVLDFFTANVWTITIVLHSILVFIWSMATIGAIQSYREEKRRELLSEEQRIRNAYVAWHAGLSPTVVAPVVAPVAPAAPEVAQAAAPVVAIVEAPFTTNLKPEELDENKEISL